MGHAPCLDVRLRWTTTHPWALGSSLLLWCFGALYASAFAYWFDAGELVAACVELTPTHPPGSPLFVLLSAPLLWLPLGPLAYRVALASNLMIAASGFLLTRIAWRFCARTLRRAKLPQHGLRATCAGAAIALLAAPLSHLQALRPEVYALQLLLSLLALDCALDRHPQRHRYALLYFTLGLLNHHLLSLVSALALSPCFLKPRALLRRPSGQALRWLGSLGALLALGCAFVPLRLARAHSLNFGRTQSFQDIIWYLSAKAYQKNTGSGVPESLDTRFRSLLILIGDHLPGVLFGLAVLGLYIALRTHRRLAATLLGLLACHLLLRLWLGFNNHNPDALGYLLPGLTMVAAFVALALATLTGALKARFGKLGGTLWLSLCLPLLLLLSAQASVASASALRDFRTSDWLYWLGPARMPAHATLVLYNPQSLFAFGGTQASTHPRPDLRIVGAPLINYRGASAREAARYPELGPLLAAMGAGEERATRTALDSLSRKRAVYLEADPRIPYALWPALRPEHLHWRVLPAPAEATESLRASTQLNTHYAQLYAEEPFPPRGESSRQLLWRHYMETLFFSAAGHLQLARLAAYTAAHLNSQAEPLATLRTQLEAGELPADLRAYLPGGTAAATRP